MTAYYEFWYCDDLGNRLENITSISQFEYVKVAGDVGLLSIATPLQGSLWETNQVDRRIHVYRQPVGGSLKLELVAFLQTFTYETLSDGLNQFSTRGHDPNGLVERRINAYHSESASSLYDGAYVSNQMTTAFRRNLGTTAGSGRNLDSNQLSLAPDISQGVAYKKKTSYKELIKILQDMQRTSREGTEIFWSIVPISDTELQFKTFSTQIGVDRSNDVVFSVENGNLVDVRLSYDWSNAESYIYVGGKAEGASRNVEEVSDNNRINQSFWGRREKFRNATFIDIDDTDALNDVGQAELVKFRPTTTLQGSMIDTNNFRYGVDWNFGDRVTINHAGFQSDTVIRAIHVRVDSTGRETISSKVELDL